ncbi:MAG: mismatch-specific DNA-glycosylase [Alphaproteobacteria bacterium]|nr:mismatch-specific DNA-glycosylase [Alphaproteobacteria bacterium]
MPGAFVLPDILPPGLDLAVCGAAAGRRSAEVGAYYAGSGNRFWRILHETGLTPRLLEPGEFRLLPEFGIGLTDLAKTASGADSEIPRSAWDADGLRRRIEAARPRMLAFNGKNAARRLIGANRVGYGLREERIGDTAMFVLPSTSSAASGYWDPEPWQKLARLVAALRR